MILLLLLLIIIIIILIIIANDSNDNLISCSHSLFFLFIIVLPLESSVDAIKDIPPESTSQPLLCTAILSNGSKCGSKLSKQRIQIQSHFCGRHKTFVEK